MSQWVSAASFAELLVACAAVCLLFAAATTAVGAALERALARSRRIWALPLAPGQWRHEGLAALRFLVLCALAYATLLHMGWVRHGEAGPGGGLLTFAVCWLGFDILYYALHRGLHTRALYRFHRHHHESRVTTPLTGFSLGRVESLGWLACMLLPPLALGLLTPVSLWGLAAYAFYNFAGNIVGHINAEAAPAWIARRGASWLLHPYVYHSLHHARFKNHYGFASGFMDRLCGTEWDDWQALYARVIAGEPLRSFSERG